MDDRRQIPRTDALLADPRFGDALASFGRPAVKRAIIAAQERARGGEIAAEEVADAAFRMLASQRTRTVLNATGVVLHTNLGRAALSAGAVEALVAAAGPTDVEFDLDTGRRAPRGRGALAALAAAVPEAPAVHLVNNGAAALVLAATALAAGREIVVSRGEMVEIGDGFRLPDLIVSTGARLCEVGTTNRTSLADYRAALGPHTGFILKVHPSNFVVRGFTSAVPVTELAGLPAPVVVDIGSGLLAPDALLPDEPDAASALRAGADLVTASGDKLLGGPQAGLLLGTVSVVDRLRRHPLARALRVDKLTLAALEATLRARTTPTREALLAPAERLQDRAVALAMALERGGLAVSVVPSSSVVGGGGAPGVELPSWGVALHERFARPLRLGEPAVVGRIDNGRLVLDLRCVPPADDEALSAAVLSAGRPV
jgi:L-seryl-tRNA(Ser) seleniumtransferase